MQTEFRESSDRYIRVIAGNQKFRIILCRDQIQWVLQRSVGRDTSLTEREWRGFSYHLERRLLIRRVKEICGSPINELSDGAGRELSALPERCRGCGPIRKTGGVST